MEFKERLFLILWILASMWMAIVYFLVAKQNIEEITMILVIGGIPYIGVVLMQFLFCGSVLPTSLFEEK